jgi:hypothetical protein
MFCWPRIIVHQYSETNVKHFLFSLLRIKGLYMFRELLAHPQEVLHKRHLVYCERVMSVGCYQDWSGAGVSDTRSTPIGVELVFPTPGPLQSWYSQQQVMLGTCRGPSSSFTVEPVGFLTVGPAACRLIVPPCFGSHLSPPGALRTQMARETSGREMGNYGREMAEWI